MSARLRLTFVIIIFLIGAGGGVYFWYTQHLAPQADEGGIPPGEPTRPPVAGGTITPTPSDNEFAPTPTPTATQVIPTPTLTSQNSSKSGSSSDRLTSQATPFESASNKTSSLTSQLAKTGPGPWVLAAGVLLGFAVAFLF